eukprot:COSAG01_NODE_1970_length_8763_cov_9.895891_1_plen_2283_part_00
MNRHGTTGVGVTERKAKRQATSASRTAAEEHVAATVECRRRGLWTGGSLQLLRERCTRFDLDGAEHWSFWSDGGSASPPLSASSLQTRSARAARHRTQKTAMLADKGEGAAAPDGFSSLSSSDEEEQDGVADGAGQVIDHVVPGKALPRPLYTHRAMGDALAIYAQLQLFGTLLKLSVFTLDDFLAALASHHENTLLAEVHMAVLRTLMRRELSASRDDVSGQQDHFHLCWLSMNGYTWPGHVRRYAKKRLAAEISEPVRCLAEFAFSALTTEYWHLMPWQKVRVLLFLCEALLEMDTFTELLTQRAEHEALNSRQRGKLEARNVAQFTAAALCAICGKAGQLIKCTGCHIRCHSRCIAQADVDADTWVCGMCTSDDACAVGLSALGCDGRFDRYWFLGGHVFREDHSTGQFFQVLDAEIRGWQAVRKGSVPEQQLAQAFREVGPRLRAERLSERLCNAFYVDQQHVDDRQAGLSDVSGEDCRDKDGKKGGQSIACHSARDARSLEHDSNNALSSTVHGVLFDSAGYSNHSAQAVACHPELTRRYTINTHDLKDWPSTSQSQQSGQLFSTLEYARSLLIRIEAGVAHVFKQTRFIAVREQWVYRVRTVTSPAEFASLLLALEKAILPGAFCGGWLHGTGLLNDHQERDRSNLVKRIFHQYTQPDVPPGSTIHLAYDDSHCRSTAEDHEPSAANLEVKHPNLLSTSRSTRGTIGIPVCGQTVEVPLSVVSEVSKLACSDDKLASVSFEELLKLADKRGIPVCHWHLHGKDGVNPNARRHLQELLEQINLLRLHHTVGYLQGNDAPASRRLVALADGSYGVRLPPSQSTLPMASITEPACVVNVNRSVNRGKDKNARSSVVSASASRKHLPSAQRVCEMCFVKHAGAYGSGRFCNRACAARFSTQHQTVQGVTRTSREHTAELASELQTIQPARIRMQAGQRLVALPNGAYAVAGLNISTVKTLAPIRGINTASGNVSDDSGQCAEGSPNELVNISEDLAPHSQAQELACRCLALVKVLMESDGATVFCEPVDGEQYPFYYEEIREPMDFGTVMAKLQRGHYATIGEFARDVRLIFSNCAIVNEIESSIGLAGERLSGRFERLLFGWVIGPRPPPIDRLEVCHLCQQDTEDDWVLCSGCDAHFHKSCIESPLCEIPTQWQCAACTDGQAERIALLKSLKNLKKSVVSSHSSTSAAGTFVARKDSACMKCGQKIVEGESFITWARTGQHRGRHYHTKCKGIPWPSTLEGPPPPDPNYVECDHAVIIRVVTDTIRCLIEQIQLAFGDSPLTETSGCFPTMSLALRSSHDLLPRTAEQACVQTNVEVEEQETDELVGEEAKAAARRESLRSPALECVSARQALRKTRPNLWRRLDHMGTPINLNTVVVAFQLAELQEMLGVREQKPRYELAGRLLYALGISVDSPYLRWPATKDSHAISNRPVDVEQGFADSEWVRASTIMASAPLATPKDVSHKEPNDTWTAMDTTKPYYGMRVRYHAFGHKYLGILIRLARRSRTASIKLGNGTVLRGCALKDMEHDQNFQNQSQKTAPQSVSRRASKWLLPENLFREPTLNSRAWCAEHCGWMWSRRQISQHHEETLVSIPSAQAIRRLARRGGCGAMPGFMYFLNEDNSQVVDGPFGLPTLGMPVAWRRQVQHVSCLASVALQARLLEFSVNAQIMREPLRQQAIAEQHAAKRIKESGEKLDILSTIINRIIDQIELGASTLVDGMQRECFNNNAALQMLPCSYEPALYVSMSEGEYIEVLQQENDAWHGALVKTIDTQGVQILYCHQQEWELLERSDFDRMLVRRKLVHGSLFRQKAPWQGSTISIIDHVRNATITTGPFPPRKQLDSPMHEQMLQSWEAVRYLVDESGRERAKLFVLLPPASVYPHYRRTIRNPITLEHIHVKICEQSYKKLANFEADMSLLFENSHKFYAIGSQFVLDIEVMRSAFWKAFSTVSRGVATGIVREMDTARSSLQQSGALLSAHGAAKRMQVQRSIAFAERKRRLANIGPRRPKELKQMPELAEQMIQMLECVIAITSKLDSATSRKGHRSDATCPIDLSSIRKSIEKRKYNSFADLEAVIVDGFSKLRQSSDVSLAMENIRGKIAAAQKLRDATIAWNDKAVQYNARLARKKARVEKLEDERGETFDEVMLPVMSTQEQLSAVFSAIMKAVNCEQCRVALFVRLPERQASKTTASPIADLPVPLRVPPTIPSGDVDMLVKGKLASQAGMLPDQVVLHSWTQESQAAFWEQRKRFWNRKLVLLTHLFCTSFTCNTTALACVC